MRLEDLSPANKKALVRVDFNVPLDKEYRVTDDTRLRGALPTIQYLLEQGAAVILMSHLGRPDKDKNEDGSTKRHHYSLQHVVPALSGLLGHEVHFIDDTVGEKVEKAAAALSPGEVLLLENTRFYQGEKKGDTEFARQLASLADLYVNDAFGTAHRAHASTAIVAQFFPPNARSFGRLMERELENVKRLMEQPGRPFVAILGGAKVSDKILLIERMMEKVDDLIIGGGMAYTFIKAQGGHIGGSLLESSQVDLARDLLAKARVKGIGFYLPVDSAIANSFSNEAKREVCKSHDIPAGWSGLDIGPEAIRSFAEVIHSAETIFWNGPMGVFEFPNFAAGTNAVAKAVAESTRQGAYSLVGGGDSVSAINKSGLADDISYISTGGGAMLTLLEGKELPGVVAIKGG